MDPYEPYSSDLPISEDSESDEVEMLTTTFTWSVRFSYNNNIIDIQDLLHSPIFLTKNNSRVKWKLQLHPDGHDEECKDYMSLFLYLVSSDIPEMQVFFKCSILNFCDRKLHTRSSMFHAKVAGVTSSGFPKFVKKTFFDNRNFYGRLTIRCKIYSFTKPEIRIPVPKIQLIEDLASLLEDEKLADVTLVASGKELKAHKAILSVRSPVFAKMFEHEMSEKRQNVVRISDIEHTVLKEVLRFVYTGRLENVEENASGLLAAADKYQLDELKAACEEALLKALTVDSAIGTLVLADRYNAGQLKLKAIDYVNAHASRVIDTPAFKALSKPHAYLIMEAYCVLAAVIKREKPSRRAPKKRRRIRRLKMH